MLKAGRQKQFFRKRWKYVRLHLGNFKKYGDTEELHQLRVEIKRMKAFVLVDEKLFSTKKGEHHFKPVNRLFKQAGKIRNAQVNMELLNEFAVLTPGIEKQQTTILIRESEKLYSEIEDYLKFLKKDPHYFLHRFSGIGTDKLRKIIDEQLKEIEDGFSAKTKTKRIHECRKKLKNLYYETGILTPESLEKLKLNRNYIKQLEQKIGDWHDTAIVISIVEKTIVKSAEIHRLKKAKEKQLKEICSMAGDFRRKSWQ